jgi:chemotaxis protein methyltransferase CheR
LSASVEARMQHLGLSCEDEYYDRLRGGVAWIVEAELRHLLNLVTVTETCFFRDIEQFRLLRNHIMPALIASPERGRAIRIWSAGSSSGEEAYSIAITLAELGLFQAYPDLTIEIIGTDLNTKALEQARRGVYSARAVRNVEGRLLEQYFRRDGQRFVLSDEIKKRVKFEFGNLTQTPMPSTGPQDIIFCKNVSIYFRPDVTRKLVRGLHDTLAPGGFLLLGHAESLWQMSEGFTLIEHERAFCYRKAAAGRDSRLAVTAKRLSEAGGGFSEGAPVAQNFAAPVAQGFSTVDTTTQYDVCLALFRSGDWAAAESALVALIRSCPTFVPAHLLLGGVYAHSARYDEAETQAESVLKLTDLEPRAHLLLGMIASRQRRQEDALQMLRRALYLDESLALAHFWLGNLYRDRGDVARACHEYENVVQDWERHTVDLTEEFASDLSVEQLVGFCRDSLQRLQGESGPH